jgi:hypothetical protein
MTPAISGGQGIDRGTVIGSTPQAVGCFGARGVTCTGVESALSPLPPSALIA